MTIKYEKVDEKYIRRALEHPPFWRHHEAELKKRNVKPTQFVKVVKFDYHNEHFYVYVEENDDRRRYTSPRIHLDTLNEIQERYYILTVGATNHGLSLHMRRDRWNECDKCHKKIWLDSKYDDMSQWFTKLYSFYNKSLCEICWNKTNPKLKTEFQLAWDKFMHSDGKEQSKAVKDYLRLEKKHGV